MIEKLPVLLLKKLTLLPYQDVRLELNVELSKKIIDYAINNFNNKIIVVSPYNPLEVNPKVADLPDIGILTKIKSKIELPNGNYRVIISGINRVFIKEYQNNINDLNILEAKVKRTIIDTFNKSDEVAILKTLKNITHEYMSLNPQASNSVMNSIETIDDLDMLTDIITNYMPFDIKKKVLYMNEFDYHVRGNNLIKDINIELQVLNLETKINDEIQESLDKEQRDYILKQKISKLNEELGINVSKQTEVSLYHEKLNDLKINEKIKKKISEEIKKYSYTSEYNNDSSIIRNYLDTILNLPWDISSIDESDLKKIKKKLDETHFGMEDAKRRIIEYIAIKKKNENINAPIICLIGPPGCGKTTLGYSISKSLNREFYKISVGGLNDANELTGHRRTYIGASMGKIMQGIKKCGTNNPVILIDEVDKIVSDFKGDPAAVLLDILDNSQNNMFIDNYLEEPFDLTNVLFILTANDIKSIPSVLKDRLEIINISSYTEFEKVKIANKYLIPHISEDYKIDKIKIKDEDLLFIINAYTKESGVRELKRILERIFRRIILDKVKIKTITKEYIISILGPKKYEFTHIRKNHPGTVSTLGVTPFGGMIISLEALLTEGNGNLVITGNVENSIKESINVAYSYVLANLKKYKIDESIIKNNNIHINAINYAIKKEGTSGGIAFATSIISLLLNKEVDMQIGFTGEITLHGDIYKVGGIKEKLIGAYNNDFKCVYIPKENETDLETIPEEIKNSLIIKCVSNYEEIFSSLFKKSN